MVILESKNHLGLNEVDFSTMSQEEISKMLRTHRIDALKQYHPDGFVDDKKVALNQSRMINEAYEIFKTILCEN